MAYGPRVEPGARVMGEGRIIRPARVEAAPDVSESSGGRLQGRTHAPRRESAGAGRALVMPPTFDLLFLPSGGPEGESVAHVVLTADVPHGYEDVQPGQRLVTTPATISRRPQLPDHDAARGTRTDPAASAGEVRGCASVVLRRAACPFLPRPALGPRHVPRGDRCERPRDGRRRLHGVGSDRRHAGGERRAGGRSRNLRRG